MGGEGVVNYNNKIAETPGRYKPENPKIDLYK